MEYFTQVPVFEHLLSSWLSYVKRSWSLLEEAGHWGWAFKVCSCIWAQSKCSASESGALKDLCHMLLLPRLDQSHKRAFPHIHQLEFLSHQNTCLFSCCFWEDLVRATRKATDKVHFKSRLSGFVFSIELNSLTVLGISSLLDVYDFEYFFPSCFSLSTLLIVLLCQSSAAWCRSGHCQRLALSAVGVNHSFSHTNESLGKNLSPQTANRAEGQTFCHSAILESVKMHFFFFFFHCIH